MKYQTSNIHCSKVISKVKVSERRTEWQNDRQDKLKSNMPPDLWSRGIKISDESLFFSINWSINQQYEIEWKTNSLLQQFSILFSFYTLDFFQLSQYKKYSQTDIRMYFIINILTNTYLLKYFMKKLVASMGRIINVLKPWK